MIIRKLQFSVVASYIVIVKIEFAIFQSLVIQILNFRFGIVLLRIVKVWTFRKAQKI